MNPVRRLVLPVIALLLSLGASACAPSGSGPWLAKTVGPWTEQFGGEQAGVTPEAFEISADGGTLAVMPQRATDTVSELHIADGILSFIQQTDAYRVAYRLRMVEEGETLTIQGLATTENGTYLVRWARPVDMSESVHFRF